MGAPRIEIIPWQAPLARVVSNANRAWTSRAGLFLRLTDGTGHIGQGEASPLPGYSRETLDDCRAALAVIAQAPPAPLDPALPIEPQLRARLAAIDRFAKDAPAARFAIETALLDLVARTRGEPLHSVVATLTGGGLQSPSAVPIAALLDGADPDRLVASAAAALERGLRTVKLKIGRPGAFSSELSAIEALRQTFGDALAIRLDVNGAFAIEEAGSRLSSLRRFDPELVEEPVKRGKLAEFARAGSHGVPLAADESLQVLQDPGCLDARDPGCLDVRDPGCLNGLAPAFLSGTLCAAVLKPMALGGILACADIAQRVRALGGETVVTHLFDGPVGFSAAAALALALPSRRFACGLDRHATLDAWPELRFAPLVGGMLIAEQHSGLGLPLVAAP